MNTLPTIESLMQDKQAFDDFVYTPWKEALHELEARKNDDLIATKSGCDLRELENLIPETPILALFRHIATPNYEVIRFLQCADVFKMLRPVLFEYLSDTYADVNATKYALGKLCFYKGRNRHGEPILLYRNVLDMAKANGKNMDSLQTVWGQSFAAFHHELLFTDYPSLEKSVIDISDWLQEVGPNAKEYYMRFLSLFLQHGILLENFLLSEEEGPFMRDVVLPSLIELRVRTGKKPLIVNLGPTGSEADQFWVSYSPHYQEAVDKLLRLET